MLNVSKVYEQLLADQVLKHLNDINFFAGDQYGFLKNSSCEGAATKLIDKIKSQCRKRFIDLKSAFDTIDTKRLICKLKSLGLTQPALDLMASYLNNRVTATRLFKTRSNFLGIEVEVPQGSKLGPLHFITYINDLLGVEFKGSIILYADDAVFTYAANDASQLKDMMKDRLDV